MVIVCALVCVGVFGELKIPQKFLEHTAWGNFAWDLRVSEAKEIPET